MNYRKTIVGVLAATGLVISLAACEEEAGETSRESETKVQQSNYDALVSAEPAKSMTNPQSRETINFWIETWDKPGALSYNYLVTTTADGEYKTLGYYILKGLPMSYCTSLTPNYQMYDVDHDSIGASVPVPAPGIDGVYYGNTDCERYYGEDATTGAYVEYTVPMNMMVRTSNEPIDNVQGAVPLGPSTIEDAEAVNPE